MEKLSAVDEEISRHFPVIFPLLQRVLVNRQTLSISFSWPNLLCRVKQKIYFNWISLLNQPKICSVNQKIYFYWISLSHRSKIYSVSRNICFNCTNQKFLQSTRKFITIEYISRITRTFVQSRRLICPNKDSIMINHFLNACALPVDSA